MGSREGEEFEVWVAITDTDLMERAALLLVFPHIILLICKFHLRQSWKNHRGKCLRGSTTEHEDIRQRLRRLEDLLVESETILGARALVSNERETIVALGEANECDSSIISGVLQYLEYLDTYWLRDSLWQSWSRAGRLKAAVRMKRPVNEVVPTTNHLESFNSVLKRKHLRRWQNNGRRLRLDILVQILILHALPSIFEQRSVEDLEARRWEILIRGIPGGSDIMSRSGDSGKSAPAFVPVAYWTDDEERDRGAAGLVANRQVGIPTFDPEHHTYTFECYSLISLTQDKNPITYLITFRERGGTTCTCHDFQLRGGACKHIRAAVVMAQVLREVQAVNIHNLRLWLPNSMTEAYSMQAEQGTTPSPAVDTPNEHSEPSPLSNLHPIMRASISVSEMVRESEEIQTTTTTDGVTEVGVHQRQSPSEDAEEDEMSDVGVTQYEDSDTESELTCGVDSEAGDTTEGSVSELGDISVDEPARDEFAELERTNQQALNDQTIACTLHDLKLAAPKLAQLDAWLSNAHLNKGATADIECTREIRMVLDSLIRRLDRMLNEVDPDWAPLTLIQPARSLTPPLPLPTCSTRQAALPRSSIMGPPVEKRAQKRKDSYSVH